MSAGAPAEVEAVPPEPPSNIAVIIIIVVVVLLLVIVTVVVVIIVFLWYRNRSLAKKGIYSPRHFNQQELGTARDTTLELKYAPHNTLDDNINAGLAPDPLSEKEAEALASTENNTVVDPSTTPTEGKAVTKGLKVLLCCWRWGSDDARGNFHCVAKGVWMLV